MPTKKCSKCLRTKPADQFGKRAANKDGLSGWCKECQRHYTNTRRKSLPKWWRGQHLKRYGISEEEFHSMLDSQKNRCAICGNKMTDGGKSKRSFNVDHCHQTGNVRGILCKMCNVLLGAADDNPAILQKAIEYLNFHSETS